MSENVKNPPLPEKQIGAPIVAEIVDQTPSRSNVRSWLLVGLMGFVVLAILVGIFALVIALAVVRLKSGRGQLAGRLAGTWVHVDEPPSQVAKAMMSVSTKVISDRVYEFSIFGTVAEKSYRSGSPNPVTLRKGTWKEHDTVNGAPGEQAIMIEFENEKPQVMFIRFIDIRNAEFRFERRYGYNFFKTK